MGAVTICGTKEEGMGCLFAIFAGMFPRLGVLLI
jgi:hypothetical protein